MRKRYIGAALLAVAGTVNALPGTGALSAGRIRSAYGLDGAAAADPDLDVLLRHRAVLFLVTGGLLLVAVARPHLRAAAVVANATSCAAFVLLVATSGPVDARLVRIAQIDVAVLGLLAGGSALVRPAARPG
jgi:hypothetical protein